MSEQFDIQEPQVTCQKCGKRVSLSDTNRRPNGELWCNDCKNKGIKDAKKYMSIAGIVLAIALVIVIIVSVVPSGGSDKAGITYANFQRIENGMTYSQVCDILGQQGVQQSYTEYEGYNMAVYVWERDGLYSYANIVVIFDNGKVSSKSQMGLGG